MTKQVALKMLLKKVRKKSTLKIQGTYLLKEQHFIFSEQ